MWLQATLEFVFVLLVIIIAAAAALQLHPQRKTRLDLVEANIIVHAALCMTAACNLDCFHDLTRSL